MCGGRDRDIIYKRKEARTTCNIGGTLLSWQPPSHGDTGLRGANTLLPYAGRLKHTHICIRNEAKTFCNLSGTWLYWQPPSDARFRWGNTLPSCTGGLQHTHVYMRVQEREKETRPRRLVTPVTVTLAPRIYPGIFSGTCSRPPPY